MKKLIALLIAVLMVLACCPVFAEEAANEVNLIGDGANTVSIAFDGQSFNEEALFSRLQAFYEATGISTEVIYVASSGGWGGFFSKIQTMIAGGDAPDLIRIAIEGFHIFLDNDMIVPLNEYAEKYPEFAALVEDNHEKLVAPFTIDGQLYGYGFDWNNVVMHLNGSILEEVGLEYPEAEWTTEQFLEYAQKCTFTREDGTKVWGFNPDCGYFCLNAWLYNWGAAILSDDLSESVINSPEAVACIQFLHDLIYKYEVAPKPGNDALQLFMMDEMAMYTAGRWTLGSYISNDITDVSVSFLPTEVQNQVISGVGIFPIAKASEKKDEAYKLAAWLSSAESQASIMSFSAIPASKTCMDNIVRTSEVPHNSHIFADSADIARSVQCPATYADLQLILDRYLSLIMADEMEVQAALDAAKAEMDMVLMGF